MSDKKNDEIEDLEAEDVVDFDELVQLGRESKLITADDPTINDGLTFLGKEGQNLDSEELFQKRMGLNIVQVGLAESQAKRLRHLVGVVSNLEDTLFEKEVLDDLKRDPRSLLALYRIAAESLDTTARYITDVSKNLDWENLQTRMMSFREKDSSAPENKEAVQQAAAQLMLKMQMGQMSKTKKKKKQEPENIEDILDEIENE